MNDKTSIKFALGLSLYILSAVIFVSVASVYESKVNNKNSYQSQNHNI